MKSLTDEQREYWREWIAALRSGKYEQGDGALCYQGKYCCLGVACNLFYERAGVELFRYKSGTEQYNNVACTMPVEIYEFLGFDCDCGDLSEAFPIGVDGEEYMTDVLTELNDSGYSFAEIADILEKEIQ